VTKEVCTGTGLRCVTCDEQTQEKDRVRLGDSSNDGPRLTFLFDNGKLICLVENKNLPLPILKLKLKYPHQSTLEPNGMVM
jgi:hypothetical protein